jgi:Gpi18-like mannosyltransferase
MTSSSDGEVPIGPISGLRSLMGLRTRLLRLPFTGDLQTALVVLAGCALALALRYSLRSFETGDYVRYTSKWFDFIQANGGWRALRFNFYNYTPPYIYLLTLSAWLLSGIHKITAVKLVSVPFDFLCAYLVGRVVHKRYSTNAASVAAFLVVLFTPTVFMNGSLWGQIDIIYTTGLVACVFFLIRGNEKLAFVAFGLALAFKLQAVFLAPLLLALALAKAVRWRMFAIIPAVYFVMMIPAWVAGRPIWDLMTIYFTQGTADELLSLNAPSLYAWLPNAQFDMLSQAGMIWAAGLVLLFAFVVYRSRLRLSAGMIVELATISVLVTPYVLPKMHDRYFFPADVFTILFGFWYPRYVAVPALVQFVSVFAYMHFLFGYGIIPFRTLAIIELVPIVILLYHFVARLSSKEAVAEAGLATP